MAEERGSTELVRCVCVCESVCVCVCVCVLVYTNAGDRLNVQQAWPRGEGPLHSSGVCAGIHARFVIVCVCVHVCMYACVCM